MPPKKKRVDDIDDWSGELLFNVIKETNTRFNPGVQGKLKTSWKKNETFYDYFSLFWGEEIWKNIVQCTNKKAENILSNIEEDEQLEETLNESPENDPDSKE
jgi:hypothetical protein